MTPLFIAAIVVLALICAGQWRRQQALSRESLIRSFPLPHGVFEKLRKRHPQLTQKDCQLVAQGLRQFFLAYLKGGRRYVAMPSQVADDLWHEFILCTKNYRTFCDKAFGGFLHHTPAVALRGSAPDDEGLRRCWRQACREENINPQRPARLPLLFALDGKLGIADGFRYVPDCSGVRREDKHNDGGGAVHCGSDFSGTDADGGSDGPDDGGSSDGGDGGGCGGGCGGD